MSQPRKHASHALRQKAYRQRRRDLALRQLLTISGVPEKPGVSSIPATARWRQSILQVQGLLDMIQLEMEQYHAARSQQWQEGDKGEAFQDRLNALAEVNSALCDLEL